MTCSCGINDCVEVGRSVEHGTPAKANVFKEAVAMVLLGLSDGAQLFT